MKATMSRDGVKRVSLSIDHRLSGGQLAIALARGAWWTETDGGEKEATLSKRRVEEAIRSQLRFQGGEGLDCWEEMVGEEYADDAWKWAVEHLQRTHPDVAEGLDPADRDSAFRMEVASA